jgi:hypothetical protein
VSTGAIRGLSSIIVPCWNQLEFTQQCLAALKTQTKPPWELIVVDNGSTDGTGLYLTGARATWRLCRLLWFLIPQTWDSRRRSTRGCSLRAGNTWCC